MAYSFRHTDSKLAGTLVREKVICGRPNCRCMKLKEPHKWYYYLYWRDYQNKGKLRKMYVPKDKVSSLNEKIKVAKTKDMEEKINLRSLIKLLNYYE